jgi:hypothetical protein
MACLEIVTSHSSSQDMDNFYHIRYEVEQFSCAWNRGLYST